MFESILVGTDGSDTAAVAVARYLGVEVYGTASPGKHPVLAGLGLDAAHVASSRTAEFEREFLAATGGAGEDVLELLETARRDAEAAGVTSIETFARVGDAADAILDVAEEQKCDLIVIGNRGMTGATRFLLGSVPNKVSHHAPCSVLIVRTT